MSRKQVNTSNPSLHSIDVENNKPVSSSETESETVNNVAIVTTSGPKVSCGCIFEFCCEVVLTIISIAMIVIGAMYLQQCPAGKYIPVYLLVGGLMGVLKPLVTLSGIHSTDPSAQTALRQALSDNSSKASSLIICFMLCWFFIGTYWIYGIYEPSYGSTGCNKTLYLFSFWLVTSVYLAVAVIVGIILNILMIKLCVICIRKKRSKQTATPIPV